MDFIANNWGLILVALASGFMLFWSGARHIGGGGIAAVDAVNLINHERAVVVDIRPQDQFEAGHIVNSRSLPMETLASQGVSGLPTNKALPLIVVCASGKTALRVQATLKQAGYENSVVLAGGIKEWLKADLPLETGPAKVIKPKK